jgi:hypothetical protein
MYDNTDKLVVSLSIYLNLFSVIGLLIFLPLHYFTENLRRKYKYWASTSYFLKKLSYILILCLISMYALTFSLLIISFFTESLSSTSILTAFVIMIVIGLVIWAISLFLYLMLMVALSVFGVTIFSVSQLINQINKY